MADELALTLLGGSEITWRGVPLTGFRSAKARALLCYLAVTDQPHTRDTLAGLLWGELPDENARASLRSTLSNLRQLLSPYLLITRQSVAFNHSAPYRLDVAAFDERVRALPKQTTGTLTAAQANALQEAVALYQGDFLAGFYVSDAPVFEEWMLVQREWRRVGVLDVLHALVAHYAAQRAYPTAIDAARRLLALEPWHEEAHRQLMHLLALDGRRSEALAQYETCRRLLTQDIGVEPAAETTALYEQIRQPIRAPTVGFTLPRHNLPPQTTPFIGRREEIAQLQELLRDPAYRLVTLVGPGGVGKTRLALKAVEPLVDRFAQGVWLVSLVDTSEEQQIPDNLLIAIAKAFQLIPAGSHDLQNQLLDLLRGKELLLVLDGLERLLDQGADFIRKALRAAPRLTVLVTSRQRLGLQAEHAVLVEGLPAPPETELESPEDPALLTYGSVRLFSERADRAGRGFRLEPHNLPDVVHICQFVAGLPLAIELAAALTEHLSPAEIAATIRHDLDRLETEMPDVPARHRSVRAVFDASWRLLPERGQSVLVQLSVLRGSFGQEAATVIVGAAPVDLQALVDRSLLSQDAAGRYRVHETVRHTAEKLGTTQVLCAARARHNRYYLDLVARQEMALYGPQPQLAAAVIQREWENVYEAWRKAAASADVPLLERGLDGLCRYLLLKGLPGVGQVLVGAAIEGTVLGGQRDGRTQRALRELLVRQARLLNAQALYIQAETTAQTAIALAEASQDDATAARGYLQLGRALGSRGKREPSRSALRRALELVRAAQAALLPRNGAAPSRAFVRARRVEAETWCELGEQDRERGSPADADAYYGQALILYRELGDRRGEALALYSQAVMLIGRGQYTQAQALLAQVLSCSLALEERCGDVTHALGELWARLGQHAEAEVYYRQALGFYNEIGDRAGQSRLLCDVAHLSLSLGNPDAADACSREALQLARTIRDPLAQGYGLLCRGHILLAQGSHAEAAIAYGQALALYRKGKRPNRVAAALAGLAGVALAQQEPSRAEAHVDEILSSLAPRLEASPETLQTYLICYQTLRANGDPRACSVLAQAAQLLQELAGKIEDEPLRRSFLEGGAAQREILRAWGAGPD